MSKFHASPIAGHLCFTKTYEWFKISFFWDGMKQDICTFLVECDTCKCNKSEVVKPSGTLQPLLIPPSIWIDIYMDFIVGIPKSGNKSVIMVVSGLSFQIFSFMYSSTPIHNIHSGSNFHG
jgi:hypothetical protein